MKFLLLVLLLLSACNGLKVPSPLDDVDHNFNPALQQPTYAMGQGPVIAIDEHHNNYHTANGRYLPFARLMRQAGYRVTPFKAEFSDQTLMPVDVLVIANAISDRNRGLENWVLPNASAFSINEIESIYRWVEQGGALLLIADHMPFPGAAMILAERFGVIFHDGFAENKQGVGTMTFSRVNNRLLHHPVVCGRNAYQAIATIKSFYGQAFRVKQGVNYRPLMRVPDDTLLRFSSRAWAFSEKTPSIAAVDMLQGATLRIGQGKVAVFGEAAMFTAQLDPDGLPRGMNDPEAKDNRQFAINLMDWLTRDYPECDLPITKISKRQATRNE